MIELGELDRRREEFTLRGVRVFAISVDGVGDTRNLQEKFQSLRMVSDEEGNLARALSLVHEGKGPDGRDIMVPTTLLVDGEGVVRWTYRSTQVVARLSPDELLARVDEFLVQGGG